MISGVGSFFRMSLPILSWPGVFFDFRFFILDITISTGMGAEFVGSGVLRYVLRDCMA